MKIFGAILVSSNLSEIGRNIVEDERNAFGRTLLDYCLRKRGGLHGASRFATLLGLLNAFVSIANKMKHVYHLQKVSGFDHFVTAFRLG